jgi:phenylacetate 2-hydroxylase
LVTAFEILPAENKEDWPELDPLECTRLKTSLTTDPKDFKVRFKPRDAKALEQWLEEAETRTQHL